MKRVLCRGKAVAASMLRQEAACLPVRFPLAPGWPLSRSLSSLAVLPMQHHSSQVSSLGAAMTCQERLLFAAQVSPATLALSVYRMQRNPGCNFRGTAIASAALRRDSQAYQSTLRCLTCQPTPAMLHTWNVMPALLPCTIIIAESWAQSLLARLRWDWQQELHLLGPLSYVGCVCVACAASQGTHLHHHHSAAFACCAALKGSAGPLAMPHWLRGIPALRWLLVSFLPSQSEILV